MTWTRLTIVVSICLAVGGWLFGDTVARHRSAHSAPSSIRFAHFGDYQDYEFWKRVIADFELANPELTVKQEYIVGLAGQYNTKMRQQVISGTLPDVALVQLGSFHEFADHFASLAHLLDGRSEGSGLLRSDLDSTGLAAFQFKGAQRGLPVWGGTLQIFGNLECFERADTFHGFPVPRPDNDWTMEDFRRTAKLLTCDFDGDGRIDQFGFWLPRWVYYLPFIWSFGADITADGPNGSGVLWEFVGPHALEAMSFYRALAVEDRSCPRDDEVPQLFQDVGFLTGKVALCVNGPWFMPFLAKTQLNDAYFVAPIPRGRAGSQTRITWDGLVMPKGLLPKRRKAAERWITFLLSSRVQDRMARRGRALPALRPSAPKFVQPPHDTQRRRFVHALDNARLQLQHPRFSEFDRVINRHFSRLIDPDWNWTAQLMLNRLAQDPVIRSIFPSPTNAAP